MALCPRRGGYHYIIGVHRRQLSAPCRRRRIGLARSRFGRSLDRRAFAGRGRDGGDAVRVGLFDLQKGRRAQHRLLLCGDAVGRHRARALRRTKDDIARLLPRRQGRLSQGRDERSAGAFRARSDRAQTL